MTIAACYLSSEAVVFGADSTATFVLPGPAGQPPLVRHYDFAQKIFEIGDPSTLGIVIWGLGSLPSLSYRSLIARFADHLRSGRQHPSMEGVAEEWTQFFWGAYSDAVPDILRRAKELNAIANRDQQQEEERLGLVQQFSGGFCIGGHLEHERRPAAFEVAYGPLLDTPPTARPLQVGEMKLWGAPNIMERILFGIDQELLNLIVGSGRWSGSLGDLLQLVQSRSLLPRTLLPLRDAIDWVNTSICSVETIYP